MVGKYFVSDPPILSMEAAVQKQVWLPVQDRETYQMPEEERCNAADPRSRMGSTPKCILAELPRHAIILLRLAVSLNIRLDRSGPLSWWSRFRWYTASHLDRCSVLTPGCVSMYIKCE